MRRADHVRWSTQAGRGGVPFGCSFFPAPDGTPRSESAYGIRFLFSGREYLTPVGLYDDRHRAYSPTLGRFLQVDPASSVGSRPVEEYAANAPVNKVDPFGLTTIDIVLRGGRCIVLTDPPLTAFRNVLKSLPDSSIRFLRITGHGGTSVMEIEKTGGAGLVVQTRGGVKSVVFTDTVDWDPAIRLADLLRRRLTCDAEVDLNGCWTADGENSIAAVLSRELPGIWVLGNTRPNYLNEIANEDRTQTWLRFGIRTRSWWRPNRIRAGFKYVGDWPL